MGQWSSRVALDIVVRDLNPGYFALVMATGIASIAANLLRIAAVAWTLSAVAAGA